MPGTSLWGRGNCISPEDVSEGDAETGEQTLPQGEWQADFPWGLERGRTQAGRTHCVGYEESWYPRFMAVPARQSLTGSPSCGPPVLNPGLMPCTHTSTQWTAAPRTLEPGLWGKIPFRPRGSAPHMSPAQPGA